MKIYLNTPSTNNFATLILFAKNIAAATFTVAWSLTFTFIFALIITVTITLGTTIPSAAASPSDDKNPNRFNRLLPPKSARTPTLATDGIHAPDNRGIRILQQPTTASSVMQPGIAGNHVDWVKTLNQKNITPLYDLSDATLVPLIFDLNIVREVKGSMPDVVYPHKQHTQWLDCSNCHPDIFIP